MGNTNFKVGGNRRKLLALRASARYFFNTMSRCFYRPIRRFNSAFRGHVRHIVGVGAKEQMGWIHTRRIIAAVQNIDTVWNCPEVDFPANSMGEIHAPFQSDSAIAKLFLRSKPEPTGGGIALCGFQPKPICQAPVEIWSLVREQMMRIHTLIIAALRTDHVPVGYRSSENKPRRASGCGNHPFANLEVVAGVPMPAPGTRDWRNVSHKARMSSFHVRNYIMGQSLFKLAIPTATFLRTYTGRCQ